MYGSGFGPEGSDECHPSDGYDRSYVYRVDVAHAEDRQGIPGRRRCRSTWPPRRDGRYVIVTNWCTFDASIVSTTTRPGGEADPARPVSAGHRGHARRRNAAYIAIMGGTRRSSRVDLTNLDDVVHLRRRLRPARTSCSHPTGRYALRHAERRRARREDRSGRRRGAGEGGDRQQPAQHGDLAPTASTVSS